MSFTYALGSGHDMIIDGSGKLLQVLGAQEVKQRIIVTLNHYWQEYFLNVPAGVPWYELLLGNKDKKLVSLVIRQAILDVPGVIGLVSLDVRYSAIEARALTIAASVEVEGAMGTEILAIEENLIGG